MDARTHIPARSIAGIRIVTRQFFAKALATICMQRSLTFVCASQKLFAGFELRDDGFQENLYIGLNQ